MAKRSSAAVSPFVNPLHDFLLSEDDKGGARPVVQIKSEADVNTHLLDRLDRKPLKPGDEPPPIPMGTRFILQDPHFFFHWMDLLGRTSQTSAKRTRYYFRGEGTAEYTLVPSLMRHKRVESLSDQHGASNPLDLQKRLLDRYKRYTQHLIHADGDFDAPLYDDFDILCLAQHYGLPTLLLDWTLNPFVAAYFAAERVTRTRLLEKLATEPKMSIYWIRIWVMRLREPKKREDQTVHLEDRTKAERWHSELGRPGMIPDGPKIVVPLVFTRRIASQVGRFVYCGYMNNMYKDGDVPSLTNFAMQYPKQMPWLELYSLDVSFCLPDEMVKKGTSVTIDEKRDEFLKSVDSMMKTLEFMGFHAGRLFPDLSGWAKYLADGNL